MLNGISMSKLARMSGFSGTKGSANQSQVFGTAGSKRNQKTVQAGTSEQEDLSKFGQQTVALECTEESSSISNSGNTEQSQASDSGNNIPAGRSEAPKKASASSREKSQENGAIEMKDKIPVEQSERKVSVPDRDNIKDEATGTPEQEGSNEGFNKTESKDKVSPCQGKRSSDKVVQVLLDLKQLQLQQDKTTHEINPLTELKRIAWDKGFTIHDNKGSGNCMFYALSDQLKHTKGIEVSHYSLRQSSVQYLRKNPKLANGTELCNFVSGRDKHPSWNEYLRRMEQEGTWGDHLILYAVANLYGISIRVISNVSEHYEETISPECAVSSNEQLVVGHLSELHYVSLQPKEESTGIHEGEEHEESKNDNIIPAENVKVPTPPNLQSFMEFTNWAKLTKLIIISGKEALRRLFDHYHPPESLAAYLQVAATSILQALKARRILNRRQWNLLFPYDDSELDSHNFDITLLIILLVHICGLNPPSTGWLANPPSDDTSQEADIVRIRILRNECAHAVTAAIDVDSFSRKWQEVRDVLLRLGLHPDEIDDMNADHNMEEELVNTQYYFKKLKADIEVIIASIRQDQEESQALRESQQAGQEPFQSSKCIIERLECLEQKFEHFDADPVTADKLKEGRSVEEASLFSQHDLEEIKASIEQMQEELQIVKEEQQARRGSLVNITTTVAPRISDPPQLAAGAEPPEPSAASQHQEVQPVPEHMAQSCQQQFGKIDNIVMNFYGPSNFYLPLPRSESN